MEVRVGVRVLARGVGRCRGEGRGGRERRGGGGGRDVRAEWPRLKLRRYHFGRRRII